MERCSSVSNSDYYAKLLNVHVVFHNVHVQFGECLHISYFPG